MINPGSLDVRKGESNTQGRHDLSTYFYTILMPRSDGQNVNKVAGSVGNTPDKLLLIRARFSLL